jgi:hypothetical protein
MDFFTRVSFYADWIQDQLENVNPVLSQCNKTSPDVFATYPFTAATRSATDQTVFNCAVGGNVYSCRNPQDSNLAYHCVPKSQFCDGTDHCNSELDEIKFCPTSHSLSRCNTLNTQNIARMNTCAAKGKTVEDISSPTQEDVQDKCQELYLCALSIEDQLTDFSTYEECFEKHAFATSESGLSVEDLNDAHDSCGVQLRDTKANGEDWSAQIRGCIINGVSVCVDSEKNSPIARDGAGRVSVVLVPVVVALSWMLSF